MKMVYQVYTFTPKQDVDVDDDKKHGSTIPQNVI